MSIFAYYNHESNCLNRLVIALQKVDGYCNCLVSVASVIRGNDDYNIGNYNQLVKALPKLEGY